MDYCPSDFSVHGDFPGKNTGVGCHFLLQGIFLTQGANPHLLHWQVDSLPLSHQGSPKYITYIMPFNSSNSLIRWRLWERDHYLPFGVLKVCAGGGASYPQQGGRLHLARTFALIGGHVSLPWGCCDVVGGAASCSLCGALAALVSGWLGERQTWSQLGFCASGC